MPATLVVPAVPTGQISLGESYADPSVSTQKLAVNADGSLNVVLETSAVQIGLISTGGANASNLVTAGKNSNTVIKGTAGTLAKILVVTLGAGACTLYDHATLAQGTVLAVVPASAAAGTVISVEAPAANGIVASASAANPALTISYT